MYRIVLIGAGDRGMIYARQSLSENSPFRIVGVAEPCEERRLEAARIFHIDSQFCFESADDLTAVPRFADAAFNCTMDQIHKDTSVMLMKAGYDILLEKPVATTWQDMNTIRSCAVQTGRKVMVCHVLRYSPFYRRIKEFVENGQLGRIISIQMSEQVSYYHESVSYVRGKYADPEICGSGMLLSKCCHDLDIMAWLMNGNKPESVCSYGSLFQFRENNAPNGSALRCFSGCPYLETCVYSAKKLYIDYPQRWANRVWEDCNAAGASRNEKSALLQDTQNPYGRCVYHIDLKIVDHQSVLVSFSDGATGTFSMNGGAAASGRSIHITGTKGELDGCFENQLFTVSWIRPESESGCCRRIIDVKDEQRGDAHGGGDHLILNDFFAMLSGKETSVCCTGLEDSVVGHQIVFAAEQSRMTSSVVHLD